MKRCEMKGALRVLLVTVALSFGEALAENGQRPAHEAAAYGGMISNVVARLRLWPGLAPCETNACAGRYVFNERIRGWLRNDVSCPDVVLLKPREVRYDTLVVVVPGGGYNSQFMGNFRHDVMPILDSGRWVAVLHYRIPRREGRPIYAAPREDAARARCVSVSTGSRPMPC